MAIPEEDHLLHWVDADGVDEWDLPFFGAGFPLCDLAADEDVEG